MRIKSKFWLEDESGDTVFGEGRRRILELIEELGSMQAAAKALNMSYRGVWARLRATEERLGVKLVETSVGRGKNRGSRLTPEARKLLANYKVLAKKGVTKADELFEQVMDGQEERETRLTAAAAVVGLPGSGRRELINGLIPELNQRGWHVAVIRLEDQEKQDAPPQDYEFAEATSIIDAGPDGLKITHPPETVLTPEMIAANFAPEADLVLILTETRQHLPSIDVFRASLAKTPVTRKSKNVLAVVGDKPEKDWPHVEFGDFSGLADLIEAEFFPEEAAPQETLLQVNGRRVPLLPFVRDIFAQAVLGMISTLKSCEKPQTVELIIRPDLRPKDEK